MCETLNRNSPLLPPLPSDLIAQPLLESKKLRNLVEMTSAFPQMLHRLFREPLSILLIIESITSNFGLAQRCYFLLTKVSHSLRNERDLWDDSLSVCPFLKIIPCKFCPDWLSSHTEAPSQSSSICLNPHLTQWSLHAPRIANCLWARSTQHFRRVPNCPLLET